METGAAASEARLIAIVTDFGPTGPYVGQMEGVLFRESPGAKVINLMSDLPSFDIQSSAFLIPAITRGFPSGTIFICVVDPGVGTATRAPVIVKADEHWFVGPDNGLFSVLCRRAREWRAWEITWRPQQLSVSFHGRDLFAPVGAMLARGEVPPGRDCALVFPDWPDDLPQVIYVDHFGNAMTGIRGGALPSCTKVVAGTETLQFARTFGEVPPATPFWYENSLGLVELAVNQGRADEVLGIGVGSRCTVV